MLHTSPLQPEHATSFKRLGTIVHPLTLRPLATHNTRAACSWGTMILTAFVGTVLVYAKADMNVHVWAEKEAMKQLKAEGVIE